MPYNIAAILTYLVGSTPVLVDNCLLHTHLFTLIQKGDSETLTHSLPHSLTNSLTNYTKVENTYMTGSR